MGVTHTVCRWCRPPPNKGAALPPKHHHNGPITPPTTPTDDTLCPSSCSPANDPLASLPSKIPLGNRCPPPLGHLLPFHLSVWLNPIFFGGGVRSPRGQLPGPTRQTRAPRRRPRDLPRTPLRLARHTGLETDYLPLWHLFFISSIFTLTCFGLGYSHESLVSL